MNDDEDYYFLAKKLAWEANVSLFRLCRESDVNYATVIRWKERDSNPNTGTVQKLRDTAERLKKDNPFITQPITN